MILGSGSVRALVRCLVCQARFRGTAEWSRCGAELTALMLLAAHVYVLRQATRLRSGSTVHFTPRGSSLKLICAAVANTLSCQPQKPV